MKKYTGTKKTDNKFSATNLSCSIHASSLYQTELSRALWASRSNELENVMHNHSFWSVHYTRTHTVPSNPHSLYRTREETKNTMKHTEQIFRGSSCIFGNGIAQTIQKIVPTIERVVFFREKSSVSASMWMYNLKSGNFSLYIIFQRGIFFMIRCNANTWQKFGI